jgi:hypothetical protein
MLGVLLAAGVVAAGAGALTYRAPAGEPPPAPEPPLVVPLKDANDPAPPAVAAAPAEPAGPTAGHRSANFRVEAPSARVAQLVGEAAEQQRKVQALRWLGKELPPWPEPCPLRVKVTLSGAGGATSFAFDKGKILSRNMQVEGSLEQLLAGVVPHEVTHAVIADHFRAPVPRWADEGIAVLAEDDQEVQRHDKLMQQILATPGRAIPLRRLFTMRDYPRDVMVLWAEGYSVTRFLVGRKDRKTFLAFVKQGMREDWDVAAWDYYGYDSVEALEDAWLADLRAWRDEKETAALPRPAAPRAPQPPEREPPPIGPMPVTGLAVVGAGGRVRIQMPVSVYLPRTSYVLEEGGKVARPVTTYALERRLRWREYDAAKVKAFDTAGHVVTAAKVRKWLAKELPVLVSADGKEVDPFYLRVIEPGALVLVVPELGAAPPAAGEPALVPPTAPLAPPRGE